MRTSAPHLFLFPRAIPSEGAAARAAAGLYASSRRMNAPVVCVQSIEPVVSARTAPAQNGRQYARSIRKAGGPPQRPHGYASPALDPCPDHLGAGGSLRLPVAAFLYRP
ncbi:MAG TPA: hypothetical protein VNB92_00195 [Rubrobacter sp.]|nr:hypothetical protein [Rubrobacter sp.]